MSSATDWQVASWPGTASWRTISSRAGSLNAKRTADTSMSPTAGCSNSATGPAYRQNLDGSTSMEQCVDSDGSTKIEPSEALMSGISRRTVGFWLLAVTQVLFFAASSAPSPLYLVYQQEWHFSSLTLTLVFASYAAALLLTLLTVGGLSDFLGRKRVLAVALVIEVLAMIAFL